MEPEDFEEPVFSDAQDQAIRLLAASVLNQAFRDLDRNVDVSDRQDAYHFLTVRLWEPDCLWGDLLGPWLAREPMLRRVDEIYQRGRKLHLLRQSFQVPDGSYPHS